MKLSRREFIESAVASGCLAAGCATTARAQKATARPNIVLCMADDQGWGDMTYNGHPVLQTPHFDAAAAAGLRFDRFYAAAPVCSPTRGSVMTGRHPNRFGCFTWGHTLRPQEITIAEALKSAGYITGHFGKWHLGPVEKGSPVNPGASGFDEWLSAPNFFDNDPILSREGVAELHQGESSMITADAAIDFMRKHAGQDQPFLAVVWFGSPHNPHRATDELRALYPNEDEAFQHFYGEITGMDRAFGKLRDELQTLGIADNTILWYCSDNGGLQKFGSTGGRGHKSQLYEGGLRVPAILEWPERIHEPRNTAMPCNTEDIYPTLLDLLGVRMPDQPPLDGISLAPLIAGNMTRRPEPMGFWVYPAKGISTPSEQLMQELYDAQQAGIEIAHTDMLCLDAGEIKTTYSEEELPGRSAWLDWP
jgi:arylsulfatase A-like enzyme